MFYSQKTGKLPPGISQLPDEIKQNSKGYPPFLTTAIPMELTGILPDVTGSGKSKIINWYYQYIGL